MSEEHSESEQHAESESHADGHPENPHNPGEAPATTSSGEGALVTPEERQMGLFLHLSVLAGSLVPLGSILGPLVLWQLKKQEMPVLEVHAKEVMNFQITVIIAVFVCIPLCLVIIGFLLLPAVAIFALIQMILGAIAANDGRLHRYPLSLRLIK